MTDFFLMLVDMSISAGWVVLAVLLLRLLLKKAPKWMNCALWALVAVRLVCPFSFESILSLVPEIPNPQTTVEETLPETLQELYWDDSSVPGDRMTVSYPNKQGENEIYEVYLAEDGTTKQVDPQQVPLNWPSIACGIWLAGIAILFVYAAVSCLRLRRKVSASINLGNGVYLCDYIASPFILGIAKPKIYLPSAMHPADAAHVLAHERAHLKRKDHWWKPLGYVLLCIHWFNPLIWVAYILLCKDIELACDERVVKELDVQEKKAYSEALLNCSVPRHMIVACPLAFGEVGVKERVKNVLHYKKPGFWILLVSIIAMLVVAVCFLTDPAQATLSDFCPGDRSLVTEIKLWNDIGWLTLRSPQELSAAWDMLDSVTYDPKPFREESSGWITVDENSMGYHEVHLIRGEETSRLYFYRDFSAVCVEDESGALNHYTVDDPEQLETFFNTYVNPVDRREVTAEPFATADQPMEWMHGITMEAIYSARSGQYEKTDSISASITNYVMTDTRLQELLDILNRMPEDAILSGPSSLNESNFYIYTVATVSPNMCVTISDLANHVGAVVRYYEEEDGDHLEFVTFTNPEALNSSARPPEDFQNVQKWDIQSEELAQYMQKLIAYRPSIATRSGWWLDVVEKPITVSDDRAQIKMHLYEGWEYEVVEPEEDKESFGIRVRPAGEDGWLYFGCWPEGFDLTIADSQVNTHSTGWTSVTDSCWPNSHVNSDGNLIEDAVFYYERIDVDFEYGDYVVLNEDALANGPENSWLKEYSYEVDLLTISWTSFQPRESASSARLSELYSGERSHATCIDLLNRTGHTCLSMQEEMDEVWKVLDTVKYGLEPILTEAEWDSLDENGEGYFQLQFYHEDEIFQTLYFYRDFSAVCFEEEDGSLTHCTVESPERLKALFETYIDPVSKRDVWGDPFADVDDPWAWVKEITPEAVSDAAVCIKDSSVSRYGYTMSAVRFEELLSLLNQLPEGAITEGTFYEKTTSDELLHGAVGEYGIAVKMKDSVNGYIGILRYIDGELALILHEEMEKIWDGGYKPQDVQLWNIESQELAAYMQELSEHPAQVTTFAGWEYQWSDEAIEVSNEEASISMRMIQDWEYEIVEYEDGADSFGIRCRPRADTRGWIYFSYWPNDYAPEEVNRCYLEGSVWGYKGYTSYPQDLNWPYGSAEEDHIWTYKRYYTDSGDFAIINENADYWLLKYSDAISDLITYSKFTGDTQSEYIQPQCPTVPLEYTQCENPEFGPKYIELDTPGGGSLTLGSGWACDETTFSEDGHTVLFSFWPEYEVTGQISVEYWEDGFTPDDKLRVEEIRVYRPSGFYYAGYTGSDYADKQWTYLWIDKEHGSYVFRMEDTDAWNEEQISAAVSEIGEMSLG